MHRVEAPQPYVGSRYWAHYPGNRTVIPFTPHVPTQGDTLLWSASRRVTDATDDLNLPIVLRFCFSYIPRLNTYCQWSYTKRWLWTSGRQWPCNQPRELRFSPNTIVQSGPCFIDPGRSFAMICFTTGLASSPPLEACMPHTHRHPICARESCLMSHCRTVCAVLSIKRWRRRSVHNRERAI
jgi:hypothetical protein